MLEDITQVAARLKGLREISEISAESLAAQLQIPLETYLSYESGTVDIPVSVLFQIAGICNVELTSLLTGEEPKLHVYSLVRKDKGVSVLRRKEYDYQNLAFNFAHKKAEPFLVTVKPDAEDAVACNAHPGQEFNHVLEGTLKIVVAGHELILNAGDSLFFDASYPHGMKAMNNAPAKFLAIVL